MTDLIERLRQNIYSRELCREAADEIESLRSFKVTLEKLEEAYDSAVTVLTQEQVDAIWAYIRAAIAVQLRNQSAMVMRGIDYIEAEHIANALESGDI